jgi:hypothetical protein
LNVSIEKQPNNLISRSSNTGTTVLNSNKSSSNNRLVDLSTPSLRKATTLKEQLTMNTQSSMGSPAEKDNPNKLIVSAEGTVGGGTSFSSLLKNTKFKSQVAQKLKGRSINMSLHKSIDRNKD